MQYDYEEQSEGADDGFFMDWKVRVRKAQTLESQPDPLSTQRRRLYDRTQLEADTATLYWEHYPMTHLQGSHRVVATHPGQHVHSMTRISHDPSIFG